MTRTLSAFGFTVTTDADSRTASKATGFATPTNVTDAVTALQGADGDTLEMLSDQIDSTSTLTAAGVRTAVGLAAANLDTQLADLPTVAEFEARSLVSADYFIVGDFTGFATPTNVTDAVTSIKGADGDTLKTLSDEIAAIEASTPVNLTISGQELSVEDG